jgi:hypothetical protein
MKINPHERSPIFDDHPNDYSVNGGIICNIHSRFLSTKAKTYLD